MSSGASVISISSVIVPSELREIAGLWPCRLCRTREGDVTLEGHDELEVFSRHLFTATEPLEQGLEHLAEVQGESMGTAVV